MEHMVKPRQRVQELLADKANFLSLAGFHSSFDELRGSEQFRMQVAIVARRLTENLYS
jgi:hypothetical protein